MKGHNFFRQFHPNRPIWMGRRFGSFQNRRIQIRLVPFLETLRPIFDNALAYNGTVVRHFLAKKLVTLLDQHSVFL